MTTKRTCWLMTIAGAVLISRLGGELDAPPRAEARAAAAQVDNHVEHASQRDPHQLSLRVLDLHVHAAQYPLRRSAVIILHETGIDAGVLEFGRLPRFHEKTAAVAEHLRLNQKHIGNGRLVKLHG